MRGSRSPSSACRTEEVRHLDIGQTPKLFSSALRLLLSSVKRHMALVVLLVITTVYEVILWVHAEPNVFPDSWAYWELSKALRAGNLTHDLFSFRTPGFPAFLALIFSLFGDANWHAVIAVQFVLGMIVPFALYWLLLPITQKKWIAAVGGGSLLLDRYTLGLQAVPLTEFLGGVLAIYLLAWYVWAWKRRHFWEAIALGVAVAIWILVRPSFQLIPWFFVAVSLVLGLWKETSFPKKRTLGWLALFFCSCQLLLGCWAAHVYHFTGHWGISHQLGASLTNHSGAFMEYAPDEYGPLRDLYVQEKARRNGNWINVYDAIDDELSSVTGMRRWELSLKYKELDKYLLMRFWREYLENVQHAWSMLWAEPSSYIVDEQYTDSPPPDGHPPLVTLTRFLLRTPLWGFIYGPLERHYWRTPPKDYPLTPIMLLVTGIVLGALRRSDSQGLLALCLGIGTVFYHMLVHAAVQFTEFGRYRLPVQALWIALLTAGILTIVVSLAEKVQALVEGDESTRREKTKQNIQPRPRSKKDIR